MTKTRENLKKSKS